MACAWMKRCSWGVRAYLLYSLQSTTTCAAAPLRLEERCGLMRRSARVTVYCALQHTRNSEGIDARDRLGSMTDAWHRQMYGSAAGVSSGRRSLHAQ